MENEFYLPQDIIHHIQSFLNARDQAQSSIVAKSWYISRPTRPVLAFNENDFIFSCEDHGLVYDENYFSSQKQEFFSHKYFSESCTKTLREHKTQNIKIDKVMLHLKIGKAFFSLYNERAGELITSSLEFGESEIELKLSYYSNVVVRYDLPAQVFESTSLTRLSIDRYIIDGVIGDRVLCSRLKSLVLDNVKTTDIVVHNIFARCPLIENLDLCHCVGLNKLNVSKLINLVGFRYVAGAGVIVKFMDFDRMSVTTFRCLRRLQLEDVRIGAEFFHVFGSMFPCVEDLTLGCFGDYDEISISSHSVRRLSFNQVERLKKVQLRVPNISKLVFEAGRNDYIYTRRNFKPLPSISFDSVPRDWESEVKLWSFMEVIEACWFEDLRKFLVQLSRSRISLLVTFTGDSVILGEEIPCFHAIPKVENLMACTCSSIDPDMMPSLLRGLSRCCCPDLITECNECYDD